MLLLLLIAAYLSLLIDLVVHLISPRPCLVIPYVQRLVFVFFLNLFEIFPLEWKVPGFHCFCCIREEKCKLINECIYINTDVKK